VGTPSATASVLLAKKSESSSPGATGASVKGVIKDVNGAIISGATVTLINETSGSEQTTTTDDDGMFRMDMIEYGSFRLRISASGFETKEVPGLYLRANDELAVDETLSVGEFTSGLVVLVSPNDPLVDAVVRGDVAAVKDLLARGSDVDTIDEEYDWSALSQAVSKGNREIVDILLNAGANVNLRNRRGHTALMNGSESTTQDIVWALIDAGAKIDLQDEDGKSALHYMAGYDNPDALRALIEGDASIDASDNEGQTPLLIAARYGNTEIVKALLKAGASVNLRDADGTTALGWALEKEYSEAAEALRAYGATE
jgi:hypothetical protein